MEENLEYLRQLHRDFQKNPGSVLLYYQICNLEKQLGLTLKIYVSVDALSGTFSYEPDPVLLKYGGYPGYTKDDFIDEDIIKRLYNK